MKVFILLFCLVIITPVFSVSAESINIGEVEKRLLDRDIDGATALISGVKWDDPVKLQTESVIECVDQLLAFYTWLNQKKDIPSAVSAYAPMTIACSDLPNPFPFSEKLANAINSGIDGAEQLIDKECGNDYAKIRVGMKLSRVQKCVGEFSLRGQVKGQHGVVDHYSRDGTYIYVKGGKVVAWGN